jgi:hypothetical protein
MARESTVEMVFVDGPKAGQSILMPNPAPRYVKMAMPEWAVYERDGSSYRVIFEGLTARVWRNPERPLFADPFRSAER